MASSFFGGTIMAEIKLPDYPSNSKKSKEPIEKKEIKPVTNNVTVKKKSLGKKFGDVFLSSDADSVGNYLMYDVFMPALKSTISDLVNKGINMFLFGDGGARSSRTDNRGPYVSYNQYYDRSRPAAAPQPQRMRYSFDDIEFDYRDDAEYVLRELEGMIAEYGMVRVADLYELVNVRPRYTDNKYGWTNLSNATISPRGHKFVINLPKARAFD